jgi:hypothetical protein
MASSRVTPPSTRDSRKACSGEKRIFLLEVGESTTVSATLVFPDDATDPPTLGSEFEPVVAGDLVTLGVASEPVDGSLSQEFVCTSAGSGFVGVSYSVLNIGAESGLFRQLGLEPASTLVTVGTVLTCASPSPAPSSPVRPTPSGM